MTGTPSAARRERLPLLLRKPPMCFNAFRGVGNPHADLTQAGGLFTGLRVADVSGVVSGSGHSRDSTRDSRDSFRIVPINDIGARKVRPLVRRKTPVTSRPQRIFQRLKGGERRFNFCGKGAINRWLLRAVAQDLNPRFVTGIADHFISPSNISVKPARRLAGLRCRLVEGSRRAMIVAFGARDADTGAGDHIRQDTWIADQIARLAIEVVIDINGHVSAGRAAKFAMADRTAHFLSPELDRLEFGGGCLEKFPIEQCDLGAANFIVPTGKNHRHKPVKLFCREIGQLNQMSITASLEGVTELINSFVGIVHLSSPQHRHHRLETDSKHLRRKCQELFERAA